MQVAYAICGLFSPIASYARFWIITQLFCTFEEKSYASATGYFHTVIIKNPACPYFITGDATYAEHRDFLRKHHLVTQIYRRGYPIFRLFAINSSNQKAQRLLTGGKPSSCPYITHTEQEEE
ncbi:MAG: hypothetical protein OSJ44_15710 [Lachnospiraceae bacterium]|nr:hypothetical protein [Lachnospiraceae bacterium]